MSHENKKNGNGQHQGWQKSDKKEHGQDKNAHHQEKKEHNRGNANDAKDQKKTCNECIKDKSCKCTSCK